MALKPRSYNNQEPTNHEKEPDHVFSESLRSFEGTPAESLIRGALEEAGIDPRTYSLDDPIRRNHNNYVGLPATAPGHGKSDEPSPIIKAIYEGMNNATIVHEKISFDEKTVRVKDDSPNTFLRRLHLIDTSVLRDAESGDAIAYVTGLSADGGRRGYVVCSTHDLDILDK